MRFTATGTVTGLLSRPTRDATATGALLSTGNSDDRSGSALITVSARLATARPSPTSFRLFASRPCSPGMPRSQSNALTPPSLLSIGTLLATDERDEIFTLANITTTAIDPVSPQNEPESMMAAR